MKNKLIEILLGVAVILLLLVIISSVSSLDNKGPEISFPEDEVPTFSEGSDTKKLLSDVTAEDNRDGDVSDSLVVESVYDFHNGNAKVIYVARDSAGNMTKAERMILYSSDSSGITDDVQDETEDEDDDESGDDKKDSSDAVNTTETTTTAAKDDEELVPDGEKPVLRLKSKEVKIKAGESFNSLNYVDNIVDDKDDRSSLFKRIIIRGTYDTKTAGTYELKYYATDSDGNMTNIETLKLVVE